MSVAPVHKKVFFEELHVNDNSEDLETQPAHVIGQHRNIC